MGVGERSFACFRLKFTQRLLHGCKSLAKIAVLGTVANEAFDAIQAALLVYPAVKGLLTHRPKSRLEEDCLVVSHADDKAAALVEPFYKLENLGPINPTVENISEDDDLGFIPSPLRFALLNCYETCRYKRFLECLIASVSISDHEDRCAILNLRELLSLMIALHVKGLTCGAGYFFVGHACRLIGAFLPNTIQNLTSELTVVFGLLEPKLVLLYDGSFFDLTGLCTKAGDTISTLHLVFHQCGDVIAVEHVEGEVLHLG